MYTKFQFGYDLKEILKKAKDPYKIGAWAFDIYFTNIHDIDDETMMIALWVNKMEEGLEFAYNSEELEKIADDLIAGKQVNL